jgi:hypothetical protein
MHAPRSHPPSLHLEFLLVSVKQISAPQKSAPSAAVETCRSVARLPWNAAVCQSLRHAAQLVREVVSVITINDTLAPVLVAAIRDSFDRNTEIVDRHEVGDITSFQEFLISLTHLEAEVRRQYLALEKTNQQFIPYKDLWPEMHEPPPREPPSLKLVE